MDWVILIVLWIVPAMAAFTGAFLLARRRPRHWAALVLLFFLVLVGVVWAVGFPSATWGR